MAGEAIKTLEKIRWKRMSEGAGTWKTLKQPIAFVLRAIRYSYYDIYTPLQLRIRGEIYSRGDEDFIEMLNATEGDFDVGFPANAQLEITYIREDGVRRKMDIIDVGFTGSNSVFQVGNKPRVENESLNRSDIVITPFECVIELVYSENPGDFITIANA